MGFPDNFWWGAGASSLSLDGAARRSDWYRWEERGDRERSDSGNGFRERFEEDFTILVEHGLRHIRLTLEWARIEPFAGRLDHGELEHVEEVLTAARDAGMEVWATLQNGSLPGWFSEDTDGFCSTAGPSIHWSRHVDRMAELFDPVVAAWIPVEDPIGWAIRGHHLGTQPGHVSPEVLHDALEGVIDATFDAHRLLSSGSTPIVGTFGLPTLVAVDSGAEQHRRNWDDAIWKSWTRAITEGVLHWPWRAPVERPDMANAFDLIGVGLTAPLGVEADGSLVPWPAAARLDASGFAPAPGQLGDVLDRVTETLGGKDLVLTGLGVSTSDDAWRAELLEAWLEQLVQGLSDGVPLRGAFLEPVIDGYDMAAGAHVDSGVFTRSRVPKPSFGWIAAQS